MLELPPGIPHDVPGLWEAHRSWLQSKQIETPRVVLHGGYGKNNLGDDAILQVLLGRVLEHLPRAEVTVLCHGASNVARYYAREPRVRACHFKSMAAVRAILQSHIYIIGGGGIINRINAYSGRERLKIFDMKGKFLFLAALGAKLTGAQTHFYAIGANSFPDAGVRFLARHVLKTADVVSVRDPDSLANLRALGLSRAPIQVLDPALSMKPASPESGAALLARWGCAPGDRPLVCIGFRYVRDGRTDNTRKVAHVGQLVRHLIVDRGMDVVFFPASQHPSQHYENDLDFGRCVLREIDDRRHFFLVEEYVAPDVAMSAFGNVDFCIFERLHAVILGSLIDVPLFVVAYDAKVAEYAKLIGRSAVCISSEQFQDTPDFRWLDGSLDEAFERAARRRVSGMARAEIS